MVLKRHKYTRAYKDGEKQHLPVALYKRAMEEKHSELRADIKDLEQAKEEKTAEVAAKEPRIQYAWIYQKEIFDTLKEWLVEPIYKAIDEMMRGHWL